jgi:two-component system OmpR family response regulator
MRFDRLPSSPTSTDVEPGDGGGVRLVVLVAAPVLRRRLCSRLAAAGHLVLADDPSAGAAELIADLHPEVVILEVTDVPERLEVTSETPGPVWVALVGEDPMSSAAAWAAGFDEVIIPPHDPSELASRVDALVARRRRRGRLLLGDLVVDLDGHEVRRGAQRISLTATEFRLLTALVRHRQQVLSKRQLLELVWGFDDYDTNVVEVHMCALRRKLESVGPRLVHTVRGVGYVARQGVPSTSTATP